MTDERQPEALHRLVTVSLQGVSEEWSIDGMDCADELRDAIATVRDDHDHEALVERPPFWYLEVQWNEEKEEVCVLAYGSHAEYEVVDSGGDLA